MFPTGENSITTTKIPFEFKEIPIPILWDEPHTSWVKCPVFS